MANKPSFITDGDWITVVNTANKYGVDPLLLAAIGKHETGWGTQGWGTKGWQLGYGALNTSTALPEYNGLANQLDGAASKLKRSLYDKYGSLSLDTLSKFNNRSLNPSDFYATDTNWANGVWNIYSQLGGAGGAGGTVSGTNTGTTIPFLNMTINWTNVIFVIIGIMFIVIGVLKMVKN